MSFLNKDLRRNLIRRVSGPQLARLVYGIIWLLRLTMRIEVQGGDVLTEFARRKEGFIGIFWHGRLLMLPFIHPGGRIHVLIGTHRDGQLIADVIHCFGFGLVRGSSSKGGKAALRQMLRLLHNNDGVGITPDGPRGPAEEAKGGVAQVARLSGKAVVPVAFSASRMVRLSSWDRFLIPKPFSRGVFVVGEPLRCLSDEDVEAFRKRVEAALKRVTSEADNYFAVPAGDR